eukprot:3466434-Pleurochrysis_carterae.AAC.1
MLHSVWVAQSARTATPNATEHMLMLRHRFVGAEGSCCCCWRRRREVVVLVMSMEMVLVMVALGIVVLLMVVT